MAVVLMKQGDPWSFQYIEFNVELSSPVDVVPQGTLQARA